ncbi:hypothetical protein CspeluHIS016_0207100 [Cutaneotrichosporon spelunceum]|uniref:Cytidine deaminase n=1 Tax=Cutaneotrichosporon spelunceum TaxID=1672016 RepID=A0AAD3TS63_9TREE|nr:hypothetical protein CspeluHIS016_0207100 [Cutaneotrichosporon spelunceum]
MDAQHLHQLITLAFKTRDRAYAPYSKFRVGAALLTDIGPVGGCNVENASYGGAICAERTAVTKMVSEGGTRILAVVVVSDVPAPTTSPCGICRQVLREFCALDVPVYIVSAAFEGKGLGSITAGEPWPSIDSEMGVRMTLGELLPLSFGPENLQ